MQDQRGSRTNANGFEKLYLPIDAMIRQIQICLVGIQN